MRKILALQRNHQSIALELMVVEDNWEKIRPYIWPLDFDVCPASDNDQNRQVSTRDSDSGIQYIIICTVFAVVLIASAVFTGFSFTRRPRSPEIRLISMPQMPSAVATPRASSNKDI